MSYAMMSIQDGSHAGSDEPGSLVLCASISVIGMALMFWVMWMSPDYASGITDALSAVF